MNVPHNDEAESAALGCMFRDSKAIDDAVELLTVDDWHDSRNAVIYETVLNMLNDCKSIDEITVVSELRRTDKLEKAGGVAYVSSLTTASATSAVRGYCEIIADAAMRRRIIRAGERCISVAVSTDTTASEVAAAAEREVFTATEKRGGKKAQHVKSLIMKSISNLETVYKTNGACLGLSTGFPDVDSYLSGVKKGEMIVLAARPSMGKSALMMDIARAVAKAQTPVLVFSLEMSDVQLADRMLGAEARVNLRSIRESKAAEADFSRISIAAPRIASMPIYISDCVDVSLSEIRSSARKHKRQHGVGLVLIDYLQLIAAPGQQNETAQLTEITRGLKNMARELDVPVIVLSQLNRQLEQRSNKRPILSDLRGSGTIEQDADVIMFIYREEYYSRDSTHPEDIGVAELIIAKQRNGPTGVVKLQFQKEYSRFNSISKAGYDG